MDSRVIYIEKVGHVIFVRQSTAQTISITVTPFRGVKVLVPVSMSFTVATRLANKKKWWIIRHLSKNEEFEKRLNQFDKNCGYGIKHHQLFIRKGDRNNNSFEA